MSEEDKYIKGYNHGYMLQRDMPDVIKKINLSERSQSPYSRGLLDGKTRFEKEQTMGRSFSLDSLKEQYKVREAKVEKDKDLER